VIVGAAAFATAYLSLVLTWRRRQSPRIATPLFAVLLSTAAALTLADRPGWGFLFIYCAVAAAVISPRQFGLLSVLVCAGLAGGMSWLAGAAGGAVVGFVASSAGIGLMMLLLRDLRARNDELTAARAELARLAVAEERERFARDLHDLLGHSLSVIALKAELAGRLLPERPSDASREIDQVRDVARDALGEVREAVSGYRQPTLDGELEGARMALSAAGIEVEVQRAAVALDPPVEAVLAWAVREGATNVIRHSGAKHCEVRVSASLADASVEVADDGVGLGTGSGGDGVAARNGDGGHGLAGLAERAQLLDGRMQAGGRPEGGFSLTVTVPVQAR
jgi:two-component system, NarL family, sensor histidine kinase DesK